MENKTKYWKGLEELNREPGFVQANKNEFAEGLPLDEVFSENNMSLSSNRRDFLKFFGFSVSAVALAACNKAPVKNVIPYVVKPEEVNPGIPNWYASTYEGLPVLVKTREGRPIKIEGNTKGYAGGGVDASGQASVLGLYDSERLDVPTKGGQPSNWKTVDGEIAGKLASIAAAGGAIRLVTGTVNSPSMLAAISEFTAKYPTTQHVTYDAISYSGIIEANKMCFNKPVVPQYKFDQAKVIVSFGADFLGNWISSTEFTYQWAKNRRLLNGEKEISKHYQFESLLSITGSKADIRMPHKPSQQGGVVIALYNQIAKLAQRDAISSGAVELGGNSIANAAKDLWANRGKSLVVCGSNDPNVQCIVNGINELLGSYGTTIDLDNYSKQYAGTDAAFETFVNELTSGTAKGVIFCGVNPAYTYHDTAKIENGIKKLELSVAIACGVDETAKLCTYVCPDNHYLESWGDNEVKAGYYTFTQPTIDRVFDTRQSLESILVWAGNSTTAYDYIKNNWQAKQAAGFSWNESIQNGIYAAPAQSAQAYLTTVSMSQMAANIAKPASDIEFIAYESAHMRDGRDANNPWLQELPDAISKVTWDNYASISKFNADKLDVKEGDTVNISVGNLKLENVPVLIQPGQARDTVAIALGYGHKTGGKVATEAGGFNVFPARSYKNNFINNTAAGVKIEKSAKSYELARTQTHHSIEGRDLVKEASLSAWQKDPSANNHDHHQLIKNPKKNDQFYTLWEEHDNRGHKWGMAIDLNTCTGCGSCIVSCSAENNVPVVGRDEVRRRREMHWIRIDRYYRFMPQTPNPDDQQAGRGFTKAGDLGIGETDGYTDEEHKDWFDHVSVSHQPMLCQHCGHAPCETVCPVLATTHSNEGLNQMTYNRCIGTKYCANNCPYKVRRFNWFRYNDNDKFDYYMNNDLGKMVLNPDVTVRTRGVMEKCSFCIQRIQYGKLQAKLQNRKVMDGEIKMACQQSCASGAIVFGDLKDPNSEISRLYRNQRAYHLLDELNTQPAIVYMTEIRNNDYPSASSQQDHAKAGHEESENHKH
ncbi:MAG TPA: TAT-variant-translocated molybdopterin oxidoreductase [Bacteroidia bacterium]|nr:TAT-variant-translocated molybdopterin oxidoreductase [Bacteroidia bacterium]